MIRKNLFFASAIFILSFFVQCKSVPIIPIPPDPRESTEPQLSRAEIPPDPPPPKDPEPGIIKMMREDIERASETIEKIWKGEEKPIPSNKPSTPSPVLPKQKPNRHEELDE
jgi:hypothetical protein